jgi:hypothetical protein
VVLTPSARSASHALKVRGPRNTWSHGRVPVRGAECPPLRSSSGYLPPPADSSHRSILSREGAVTERGRGVSGAHTTPTQLRRDQRHVLLGRPVRPSSGLYIRLYIRSVAPVAASSRWSLGGRSMPFSDNDSRRPVHGCARCRWRRGRGSVVGREPPMDCDPVVGDGDCSAAEAAGPPQHFG